jgi:two-component system, LuxR family, sensor kinase FixL
MRLDLATDLPAIPVDPIQLQQVVANLIQNSFDALESLSEYRRQLTLHTGLTTEGDVEIAVIDRGSGIDPALRGQIFEPFFTTRKAGTGMGLALVRSILEGHGGSITVEGTPEGGATFRCRLPASGAIAAAAAAAQSLTPMEFSRPLP